MRFSIVLWIISTPDLPSKSAWPTLDYFLVVTCAGSLKLLNRTSGPLNYMLPLRKHWFELWGVDCMPSIPNGCCSKQFSCKLTICWLLRIAETSTVVIGGVKITKYPVYREPQVFDFDRSGETASLAEGLIIESENGETRTR